MSCRAQYLLRHFVEKIRFQMTRTLNLRTRAVGTKCIRIIFTSLCFSFEYSISPFLPYNPLEDCDTTASTTKTYWDGGTTNLSCLEYKGCSSGRQIMRCFYDGGHMDLPDDGVADQITLWWFGVRKWSVHLGLAWVGLETSFCRWRLIGLYKSHR